MRRDLTVFAVIRVIVSAIAAHVASGILLLGLVYRLTSQGRFTAQKHWPIAAVLMYWHFVDVVWVFCYPLLYLIN